MLVMKFMMRAPNQNKNVEKEKKFEYKKIKNTHEIKGCVALKR